MGKKRVYEAARRLNLETSELMKLLQQQGITVKSPISFISEDDFEKVSSSFASSQEKPEQPAGAEENKQETAAVDEEIEEPNMEEPEPKKEADVIPISRSRKGDEKDERESDEEGPAAEDTNTTKQAVPPPAPSGEETPQQEPTTHQPELAPTGTGGFTAAVSYMPWALPLEP